MSRPKFFPPGIIMTPLMIARIRENQREYDKDPKAWERRAKERKEEERREAEEQRRQCLESARQAERDDECWI